MNVTNLKNFVTNRNLIELNKQLKNIGCIIYITQAEVKEGAEGKAIIEYPYKEKLIRKGKCRMEE